METRNKAADRKPGGRPDPLDREFRRAFWKLHVLHHAAEKPVYGLWLLEELSSHGYRVSPGTLYPLLARMVENGWLDGGGPRSSKERRVYRITREGRRVLAVLRRELRELHREVAGEGA